MNAARPMTRSWRAAAVLWTLSFAVVAVIVAATPDYEPRGDSSDFVRHGLSIAQGDGYPDASFGQVVMEGPTAFRPPAYPYMLAGVFLVSGDSFTAARLATGAVGALSVVLLFLLVQELWGFRAGLVAGALAAVLPPLVVVRTGLFSEPLFIALMLGASLLILRYRARPDRVGLAAAAGLLSGLAALTRSSGILVLVVVALLAATADLSSLRRIATAATVLAVGLAAIAPWSVRNMAVFDRWVPISTQTGFTYIQVLNAQAREAQGEVRPIPRFDELVARPLNGAFLYRPELDEAELDSELRRRAFDYAKSHPGYVVEAVALNTLRSLELIGGPGVAWWSYGGNGLEWPAWARTLTHWTLYALYAFALAGAALLLRGGRRRPPAALWLIPIGLLLSSTLAAGASRYRAPVDPFLVALAALPIAAMLERLTRGPVSERRFLRRPAARAG